MDNVEGLNFGQALEAMRRGEEVTRIDWYGSAQKPVVGIYNPTEETEFTEPFLYMRKIVEGKQVVFPLDLSCESILSTRWGIVKQ